MEKLTKLDIGVPDLSLLKLDSRQDETASNVTWQPRSTIVLAFAFSGILWASILWLLWLFIGR